MPNLPLRTRRRYALGINKRLTGLWASRKTTGLGNRAMLTTATAGVNNDVTLIARTPGTTGNAIRFRIVVAGASTPASVSVSGSDITFNSATSAGSAATSTAKDMVTALLASDQVKALAWPQIPQPGEDGSGVVVALAFTSLAGAV
jgi:tripartite-type tricarboxylate transporter receptor subunit TctC